MADAKITKEMVSNSLYTLFFSDGSSFEICKNRFRGVPCPKVGDYIHFRQEKHNGKIVTKIFLNGKETEGKPLTY